MTKVPTTLPTSNVIVMDPKVKAQNQLAAKGDFNALLTGADNKQSVVTSLLDQLANTKKTGSTSGYDARKDIFPFSAQFESVFGVGGPLPDFINMITAKLNLSAEKNMALQQIAINNKDATRTPESIKKIGDELKQAGIF